MMRPVQLRHTITYGAPRDQVFAMLTDEAFRRGSVAAQGGLGAEVSVRRAHPPGTGASVRIEQLLPTRGVPAPARRFVDGTVRLVQLEEWSHAGGATLVVRVPGLPVDVVGRITLEAVGGAAAAVTRQTVEATVDVRVPLLGERLAGFVGGLVSAGMDTEQQVGEAWLRGDRQ